MQIESERLILRKLVPTDVCQAYLDWLNNPDLQRYTRRRGKTTTMAELRQFVSDSQISKDYHLAIVVKAGEKHIGNIFLNSVDLANLNADLSIMIGDSSVHGQGYASEAIKLLTDYAFNELKFHRLYAGSPNPAFNKLIQKLGWEHEGVKREAFYLDGKFLDIECWAILNKQ